MSNFKASFSETVSPCPSYPHLFFSSSSAKFSSTYNDQVVYSSGMQIGLTFKHITVMHEESKPKENYEIISVTIQRGFDKI